ncbi:FAD-dependent monooxygenase [Actinoplanes sp. NPDC049265]|uniref:FAD-dependent monooxygenase n=1 Tax=Actinoplanes sp. NPDC049265 TaxID=3363902 RepID=UPI003721521D
MTPQKVLIVGAGVAGPALAYWLTRHGFRTTVVERASDLRSSGNPIDVKGPAVPVAERMGLMPKLRGLATRATAITLLHPDGRAFARTALPTGDAAGVELARSDLSSALYETARDDAEFVFGDSVTRMHQDPDGVEVTFGRSAPRRFDLVVGADGMHSTTRRLVFGPETEFATDLGMYVATVPLPPEAVDLPHDMVLHNTPGRLLAIHPGRDNPLALFVFRGPSADGYDRHDTDRQKRLLTEAYAGVGWRAPELVERFRTHPAPFFDALNRVRMASWSRGRVALLGDAASSVALFGDGSSLAVAGAYTLAQALAEHPGDHARAFAAYETRHRRETDPRQRRIPPIIAALIPRTGRGVAARNCTAGAALRLSRRRLTPLAAVG